MASSYDERNSKFAPISDALHFQMRLVLADLPESARILCVGVGTGADILALARDRPGWAFVGVDPSPDMLAVARRRTDEAGYGPQCSFQTGYVDNVTDGNFDAVVCLLVAHFVQPSERPDFYRAIHARLKPGGIFVSAEISADLRAAQFPAQLEDWRRLHRLGGADEQSLARMGETLANVLGVVAPMDTERLWREAGFPSPTAFFQAFLIRGWHGARS